MISSDEDLRIARLIQGGDAAAFRALADEYAPRLLHFAARLLRNTTQAEDVVQETFLRLWTKREEFKGQGSLSGYLYKITHRLCLDVMKSASTKRYGGEIEDDAVRDPGPHPDEALTERSRLESLEAAIGTLPERQRAALLLRVEEGLSQREIAAILGESEESVESLLARARQKLRATLAEKNP